MRNTSYRYFLYARKSSESEDRQMASIDDQINEVQKLAERFNIQIVDIISESKSAKEPGRPLFNKMLQRIHKGEAEGILTWKLNRLARNPIDGGQISWMLQQNIIRHIQTFERDYNPTDNVLLMQVEFGMANQYVKDLSIDVKRGMRQKAERGWCPVAMLPIGYSHNPQYILGVNNEIISNDEQLKILKKLWQIFLTGKYSIASLKKKGDLMGLKTKRNMFPSRSAYHAILTNEFYSGFFYWKDKEGNLIKIKGKHEAIICPNDFQKTQYILNGKSFPTSKERKNDFPYRGIIHCGECGCTVTPDHKLQAICTKCKYKFSIKSMKNCPMCNTSLSEMKNPSILDKLYYYCTKSKGTCSQTSIKIEDIENTIKEALKEISISKEAYRLALNKLKEQTKDLEKDKILLKTLNRKKTEFENRLSELVNLLADRKINVKQYNQSYSTTQQEILQIESQIDEITNGHLNYINQAKHNIQFSLDILKRFENGNYSIKTEILQEISSNLILKDKKLYISMKKMFLDKKMYS